MNIKTKKLLKIGLVMFLILIFSVIYFICGPRFVSILPSKIKLKILDEETGIPLKNARGYFFVPRGTMFDTSPCLESCIISNKQGKAEIDVWTTGFGSRYNLEIFCDEYFPVDIFKPAITDLIITLKRIPKMTQITGTGIMDFNRSEQYEFRLADGIVSHKLDNADFSFKENTSTLEFEIITYGKGGVATRGKDGMLLNLPKKETLRYIEGVKDLQFSKHFLGYISEAIILRDMKGTGYVLLVTNCSNYYTKQIHDGTLNYWYVYDPTGCGNLEMDWKRHFEQAEADLLWGFSNSHKEKLLE